MIVPSSAHFDLQYQSHLKHLKLRDLQPKTIEAYARAIRRIGDYFDLQIDSLTEPQLAGYFSDLVDLHSWSTVKLDLYGLTFSRACPAQTLGGSRPDQAPKEPAFARHCHGREGEADFRRHAGAQLSGVFLHSLQPGLASGRRAAASGGGYRRGARPRMSPQ